MTARVPSPTRIEWADRVWNPITGCNTGCSYCYARREAKRFGDNFTPKFHPERLEQPLHLQKPSKIFVCSMGELFGPWVPLDWVKRIYDVMTACVDHTFIVLTKWPEKITEMLYGFEPNKRWPLFNSQESYPNIWHLASVEDQKTWDKRVPALLELRSHGWPVLGVSVEPMLGEIIPHHISKLDWLIIGGQSPPSAQQPKRIWTENITDAAVWERVPVFQKNNLRPILGDNVRQEVPK